MLLYKGNVNVGGAVGWGTALQAGSIPDGVTWIFH
jgi:hypothetical protein